MEQLLNQAVVDAWPYFWPKIATEPNLIRFKSEDKQHFRTGLDPLNFVNPTTHSPTYGFSKGDCSCRKSKYTFDIKVCYGAAVSGILQRVTGLSGAKIDGTGAWSAYCNSANTQKYLVYTAKVSGNVQVDLEFVARVGVAIPGVGCHNITQGFSPDASITVDIQIMFVISDATQNGTSGISVDFAHPIVIVSHPIIKIDLLTDIFATVGAILCGVLPPVCPAISGQLADGAKDIYKLLDKKVAEAFKNPITFTIPEVPVLFIPYIAVADLCGGKVPLGGGQLQFFNVVPPELWPCIPDDGASAYSSGPVASWVVPCTGAGNTCTACIGSPGSTCPVLPGVCNFGCSPVCNPEQGFCCGSQQVCVGGSTNAGSATCCTPRCSPCQAGSDGCGGQCHLACADPAQTCGSGSAAGQCVTVVNPYTGASEPFAARAMMSPRHGPVLLSMGAAPRVLYFADQLTPGTTLAAVPGFPAFFSFTPTGSGTWTVSTGDYVAGTGGLDRNPNTRTTPLTVLGSPSDPVMLVAADFPGTPLQVSITPTGDTSPTTFFLTSVIGGQTYTLSEAGGNVVLVAGPPKAGSVHWMLGGCNVDSDCASGQFCAGVACFAGNANYGSLGSFFTSTSPTTTTNLAAINNSPVTIDEYYSSYVNKSNKGAAVGGSVAGGIIALALIIAAIVLLVKMVKK